MCVWWFWLLHHIGRGGEACEKCWGQQHGSSIPGARQVVEAGCGMKREVAKEPHFRRRRTVQFRRIRGFTGGSHMLGHSRRCSGLTSAVAYRDIPRLRNLTQKEALLLHTSIWPARQRQETFPAKDAALYMQVIFLHANNENMKGTNISVVLPRPEPSPASQQYCG